MATTGETARVLKALRKAAGLTQRQLAALLGEDGSEGMVATVETSHRFLSTDAARALATHLGGESAFELLEAARLADKAAKKASRDALEVRLTFLETEVATQGAHVAQLLADVKRIAGGAE